MWTSRRGALGSYVTEFAPDMERGGIINPFLLKIPQEGLVITMY